MSVRMNEYECVSVCVNVYHCVGVKEYISIYADFHIFQRRRYFHINALHFQDCAVLT